MSNNKRLFIIFALVLTIYLISSPGDTPYNYFTRLSQSFLNGKLFITQNFPWLNELVPVKEKYYIVYPPMPAIVLLPYVFLLREYASQTLFFILMGSFNIILVYVLLQRLKISPETSLSVSLFFAFGTNHWYLVSVGSAWFAAHITALFFFIASFDRNIR